MTVTHSAPATHRGRIKKITRKPGRHVPAVLVGKVATSARLIADQAKTAKKA